MEQLGQIDRFGNPPVNPMIEMRAEDQPIISALVGSL
jgi:hypothetical protein